jgi:phage tail-like protein
VIERTAMDATGAHWFEVLIDPPEGHLPIWTMATWFLVRTVSGLSQELTMEPIWEGGASGQYRMLPKKKQWPNLVLQGVVALKETAFFDWFDSVKIGKIKQARADGLISLMSGDLPVPVATWSFTGAFPVKYVGPTLDKHNSLLAFESIELTHKGLERMT